MRGVVATDARPATPASPSRGGGTRIPWAQLLKHGLGIDALRCPVCSKVMEPVALVTDPLEANRYLANLRKRGGRPMPERAWRPVPLDDPYDLARDELPPDDLIQMDGDLVEASNVSRILGATVADVGRTNKADVAARYARGTGVAVSPVVVPRMLLGESEMQILRGCDVVFSCVDRETPRALLNRLAYEAFVPVIDMGTAFRVDARGAIVGDAERVVVVGPGRRCLACFGHLDPETLRREALSAEDRSREERAGYIEGAQVQQPSVMAFNVSVAGAAVVEFLRLATGFAGADDPPQRLAFSFTEGTVRRNRVAGERQCSICQKPGHVSYSRDPAADG